MLSILWSIILDVGLYAYVGSPRFTLARVKNLCRPQGIDYALLRYVML